MVFVFSLSSLTLFPDLAPHRAQILSKDIYLFPNQASFIYKMQRKSSQSRGKSDDHIHVNQTPSMKRMTGRNHHEGDLTAVQWVAICFVVITTISTMGLLWHHHFLFANPTYSYSDCELYMAPSLIPNAGRGVFAGKRFDRLAEVDVSASISLPIEELYYQQVCF